MQIGLLGGSFDPIHNGHLHVALLLKNYWHLDQVWFLPTKQNPLKESIQATDKERLEMIKLAISPYPFFSLSLEEINSPLSPSYTIDTLSSLKKKHPKDSFLFLIGSDLVSSLIKWKEIEALAQITTFLVTPRKEKNFSEEQLPLFLQKVVKFTPSEESFSISSKEIRENLREHKKLEEPLSSEVPEKVLKYIYDHCLYQKERL